MKDDTGSNIIYVVTPSPIRAWMDAFVEDQIQHKSNIKFVDPRSLNPETVYYYQTYEFVAYRDAEKKDLLYTEGDARELVSECKPISKEESDKKIEEFVPQDEAALEMYASLKQAMNLDQVIAVEVDHCPQSYACMLVAKEGLGPGGKIIYSGDTTPCTNLINYARGCSLLIHEATLQTGME